MAAPNGNEADRQQFLDKLQGGLQRCGMDNGPTRLLVALSGGADSSALLLGLIELAGAPDSTLEIETAHFNHQLRDENSNRDEQTCRELCDRLRVSFHSGRGDVAAHAKQSGMSIEAAARELRYSFLADTVAEHGFDAVVTGHTMDDQAETVLLAITRGAGLRGLSGMAYVTERPDISRARPLRVLRPMLAMRRRETEQFCDLHGVKPIEDESNSDISLSRNRIRHNVLPELAHINPAVTEAVSRLAEISRADTELIDNISRRLLKQARADEFGGLSRKALLAMEPALQLHVIAAAFKQVTPVTEDMGSVVLMAAVDAVNSGTTGNIDLPHGAQLVVEHDTVRFLVDGSDDGCPYPASVGEHVLTVPGEVEFSDGKKLKARRVTDATAANEPQTFGRWQALLSAGAVNKDGFNVRSRRDGDRFYPLGMPGEMKLQDFFVNQHVPSRWRDRVPLIIGKQGICWVAGERVAEWAKVEKTMQEVVLLEFVAQDAC